eukprot:CAMPEP_0174718652 /NCGR_PEP_ID=MMETSP1094-20130205/29595_1 /TAXON_ID=156173 /ORGANISM="Chrysochromulina brevifilum, Strain UTEX LB 985" /LENGTH=76 /DNA_ID=CAMNT_0015918805 /DNA_START=24 /DNA_END=251 /DNA_ORIENTATION=+
MGSGATKEMVKEGAPTAAVWEALVEKGIQYEVLKVPRQNTLVADQPKDAKYKLAVVQFKVPGAKNGGSDKGPDGNR